MPDLATIPSERPIVIVVGTSVRKSHDVLKAHLDTIAWQQLPRNVQLVPVYVPDWLDPDDPAAKYLAAWVKERNGHLLRPAQPPQADFQDTGLATHQWTTNAMRRVGANKDLILAKAAQLRADAVWFVDADLLCDRTTLWSLYHAQAPIACGVYWTRWHRTAPESRPLPSGPQVWLRHPYELSGRGMEEAEFRRALAERALTSVAGQGACTLVRKEVWEAGVSFRPAEGVSQEGMMAGEDRHFCIHAERRHIPMIADPWPDIFHIYHLPDDLAKVPAMRERLGAEHPRGPKIGDWVSILLQPMEPVPQPNGQAATIPAYPARGRLGGMPLLPDLEAAIPTMQRGEERIVKAACGLDNPIPQYRNQKRLFRITLLDCKPFGYPPVLEEDLHG